MGKVERIMHRQQPAVALFVLFAGLGAWITPAFAEGPNVFDRAESAFAVPDYAHGVTSYILTEADKIPDDPSEYADQTSFQTNLSYPGSDVIDFYVDHYEAEGWTLCQSGGWESFVNGIPGTPPERTGVRQYIQYIVDRENGLSFMVVAHYYGTASLDDIRVPTDWNNNDQYVTVIEYDLGDELEDNINRLELVCDGQRSDPEHCMATGTCEWPLMKWND